MKDYRIDDDWILNRISGQSNSFSQWLSNIMNSVEKTLEEVYPEALEEFKKDKKLVSFKDLDKDLSEAQKELDKLGFFGKRIPSFATKILSGIQKPIEKHIKKYLKDIEGLDLDLDFITGKKKDLSTALFDVSKERGIESEGLLYLIRALPDLEAFLYSTSVRKYYRDHTEHALRVAVLGDFLLEQDLGQGSLEGVISELTELDKNLLKDKFWWITGLLHDIGYPLGKMTTAVNYSLLNQLLKCYPTLDLEFIPFEINLAWKGEQEEYLKIIEEGLSKEARELIRQGAGFKYQSSSAQDTQTFLNQPNGHPEFKYKNPVELDHGVISALSLLKGLGSPHEIKQNDEYDGYILAARAMALHNFKAQLKDYVFEEQPLAFFLMLIDELQEWGRPIPVQIRDTYFTTELQKVTLLDELLLSLDEFSWLMKFKNQQAKDLMKFNFNLFSNDKKKTFGRLKSGDLFPETTINLQDIKIIKEKKEMKENIIAQDTIII
ncbi:MAG: hypothetical protein HWN81_20265 [Candidatus Lokiarchaeota archaeon]|nr:hypothetical protein [Candidatus Lokiarchaeota archaeon]